MKSNQIYVTQPVLPDFGEYSALLEEIWHNKRLTNFGPFHQELEEKLAKFFGVEYVSLFCNGTVALQTGLQALKINGDVITTPYSFPATTHAIYWNQCNPVFCDIDPNTYNIDSEKIESLITPNTTCIVPVHTYGTPCNVEKLKNIADVYGLKIIYDAAHVFGETFNSKSLMDYGDLSMISFHATKVFNTIEGGALVTNDPILKKRIDYLKNFGFYDEETVIGPGINGKMNEIQAAFGLCLLKDIDHIIFKRQLIANRYVSNLNSVNGLDFLKEIVGLTRNWSYFPIFINRNLFYKDRNVIHDELKEQNIFTRKYFYPLISDYSTYRGLPSSNKQLLVNAHKVADEVLCLPIYPDLDLEIVDKICEIILSEK